MASHDFCYGCDECRRDERNTSRSIEIDKIRNAIEQLRNIPQVNHVQYAIGELEKKIEQIKSTYEYKNRK